MFVFCKKQAIFTFFFKFTGTPSSNSLPILHQNGNGIKKNGLHDETGHNSSASSTSTLTGQRGPIPLTIKTLEAENKRKTLLAEAAAAAAGKEF